MLTRPANTVQMQVFCFGGIYDSLSVCSVELESEGRAGRSTFCFYRISSEILHVSRVLRKFSAWQTLLNQLYMCDCVRARHVYHECEWRSAGLNTLQVRHHTYIFFLLSAARHMHPQGSRNRRATLLRSSPRQRKLEEARRGSRARIAPR